VTSYTIRTPRLVLRPLRPSDFPAYSEVRTRCAAWLTKWEPRRPPRTADPARDPASFSARCAGRDRDRQLGTAYAFGMFAGERFCGEINLNNVVRGAFQSANVGYWVDEAVAGRGLVPEGLVGVLGFAFDELGLHRVQISIIPRNTSSRRVVEKLGIRDEGVAARYLEIDGVWEDHVRYAITAEEWSERAAELKDLGWRDVASH
jgi:ribosomal-protein-alanine N-acetyltransferase